MKLNVFVVVLLHLQSTFGLCVFAVIAAVNFVQPHSSIDLLSID